MRTYVIADLHGRYDLFRRAVALVELHALGGAGTLIVTGDFIDRGPASRAIVERLMRGPASEEWRWHVLQGNHEAMMLAAAEAKPSDAGRCWMANGGSETLRSYGGPRPTGSPRDCVPREHLAWLAALPISHEDDHRIYVHAGLPADLPLEDAEPDLVQWMRYGGDRSGRMRHADGPHVSGKHIVHGHDPMPGAPLLKAHRTNLDSLAWHTGRLAVGVFDDAIPGGPVEILWVTGPAQSTEGARVARPARSSPTLRRLAGGRGRHAADEHGSHAGSPSDTSPVHGRRSRFAAFRSAAGGKRP